MKERMSKDLWQGAKAVLLDSAKEAVGRLHQSYAKMMDFQGSSSD
jgi:hypothetical protein